MTTPFILSYNRVLFLSEQSDKMHCEIFKSNKKLDTYLYMQKPADTQSLPDAIHQVMGDLIHVMELEITENKKLAQAKAGDVLENIQRQGFYLQLPPDSQKRTS